MYHHLTIMNHDDNETFAHPSPSFFPFQVVHCPLDLFFLLATFEPLSLSNSLTCHIRLRDGKTVRKSQVFHRF
jgi:hypothetical protein